MEASMERRAFLRASLAGIALLTLSASLPAMALAEPLVIEDQVIASADVVSYPVGTTFRDCSVSVTETLPLGYHFDACHIQAMPDFKGEGVLVFPGDPTPEESRLMESTSVTNCYINCLNANFAVYGRPKGKVTNCAAGRGIPGSLKVESIG